MSDGISMYRTKDIVIVSVYHTNVMPSYSIMIVCYLAVYTSFSSFPTESESTLLPSPSRKYR